MERAGRFEVKFESYLSVSGDLQHCGSGSFLDFDLLEEGFGLHTGVIVRVRGRKERATETLGQIGVCAVHVQRLKNS